MEGQIELTAESLWSDVSARLREALNQTTYNTWFGAIADVELEAGAFELAVPNEFVRGWIEGHLYPARGRIIDDGPRCEGRAGQSVRLIFAICRDW